MYKWDSKKTIKVDTFWEINMQTGKVDFTRFHPTVIFILKPRFDFVIFVTSKYLVWYLVPDSPGDFGIR